MIFDVQYRVKQYQDWLVKEDMSEVFSNHRRWLQLLQWHCPGDTWVLKSPQYLWNIQDMLVQYPDARVIQTHRDPVKVAVSVASLTATLRSLGSNDISLPEIAQDYVDLMAYGNSKTSAARDAGLISADSIIDIQFSEFREDPVAMVHKVYDFFELAKNTDRFAAMGQFLKAGQESERHGKHKYNFADTGLNLETQRKRFAQYQQQYGVKTEQL